MNLYYIIWVDGIKRMQSVSTNNGQWKSQMMIYMSMAMALNLMLIVGILQRIHPKFNFYSLNTNFFPGEKLNNFFSFFILFLLPALTINYLLIYRNNRYEKLLEKYKYYNGKLVIIYFFGTLIISFIAVFFFIN